MTRPVLMSGAMVRAVLDGRKNQTRRLAWKDAGFGLQDYASEQLEDMELRGWLAEPEGDKFRVHKPTRWQKVKPGQLLWVRESMRVGEETLVFDADGVPVPKGSFAWQDWLYQYGRKTIPSIHMPRWASRLTLEVTGVKVERLQDISREDAIAEGLTLASSSIEEFWRWPAPFDKGLWLSPVAAFRSLWTSINGPGSWEANPWIVAVSFKSHKRNIDQVIAEQQGDVG